MKKRVQKIGNGIRRVVQLGCRQEPGIDGILVTVGLCVIALLLCVVMKDSLRVFMGTMATEAQKILTGVTP